MGLNFAKFNCRFDSSFRVLWCVPVALSPKGRSAGKTRSPSGPAHPTWTWNRMFLIISLLTVLGIGALSIFSKSAEAATPDSSPDFIPEPPEEDVVDLDPSEYSEKTNPDSPWNKIEDR